MKVVQDNMKKIWVNGTFDVLHIGHIKLLEFASRYGIVRVGIDSDIRVKQLKGELRPINTIDDRLEFMSSIKYVDSVVSFSSDKELCQKIKEWSTDIIIVGSDYRHKPVIGSELVSEVIIFDKLEGFSTTNIIGNKL
jgi:D-beta-D-heptose 7-phosphate kinase/D-beta-D-heptose 1-phosphate adenosyltransferase